MSRRLLPGGGREHLAGCHLRRDGVRLLMRRTAIPVRSVDEEDAWLGNCNCGDSWRLVAEDVVPISHRWFDALVLSCRRCGGTRRAIFDITSFFTPPSSAWARVA